MPNKRCFSNLPRLLLLLAALLATALLCVCLGSVPVRFSDALSIIGRAILGLPVEDSATKAILLSVRLPRVLCVALVGASLSLCGAGMQGLLRNPLADGSTLGVSSGASLGAVLALAFGAVVPGFPALGVTGMAMVFAFLSLVSILTLAYRLDRTLATHTIILIGVIFSMFVSSLMSLVITFSGEKLKTVTFWTMGSLAGASYRDALLLLAALAAFGGVILANARELNAFAIGEDNARQIGVNVRRVKLTVLIAASALIGVCVSVGGTIGFVGLVTPHMTRMLTGPDHKKSLPATLLLGAVFLLLGDLAARTVASPLELPIGVVTSLVGALAFVVIFVRTRRAA